MSKKKRAEKLIGKIINLGGYLGHYPYGDAKILNIIFDTPAKTNCVIKQLCIHVEFLNEYMKKEFVDYMDVIEKTKHLKDKIGTNPYYTYSDRRIHKYIK